MSIYLAYQFQPRELTRNRLVRLMDDYFDFNMIKGPKNAEEWLESVAKQIKRCELHPRGEIVLRHVGKTLLEKASYFATHYNVKNHPLLEIYIRYQDSCYHCPENFTGLNIWAGHSGSEGVVDLIKFEPEISSYLSIIGINYDNRSVLHL